MLGKKMLWKDRLMPTTSVSQSRLQFFQPTRQPKRCVRVFKDEKVTVSIEGRLGVMHALLLESVFFFCEQKRSLENGAEQLLVDPYKVRKALSGKSGAYSAEGMQNLFADLREATIKVTAENGWAVSGIINEASESQAQRLNPITGKARGLLRVEVSPAYLKFLYADMPLHYDPTPLGKMRHGITPAVARLALSHRADPRLPNGGSWHLNTLIAAVGAETTGQKGKDRRNEIRDDSESLAAAGLLIIDGQITRKNGGGVVSTPGGVVSTPGALSVRQGGLSLRQRG